MKKIILDTNFLLIPIEFHVDIFTEIHRICNFEYKLCIIDSTLEELKRIIEQQKGKHKKAAQFALKMTKLKGFYVIKSEESYVDKAILDVVDKNHIVATQDIELKKKLIAKKVPVIIMRNKEFLQFAPA